jgi:hypothetical protein
MTWPEAITHVAQCIAVSFCVWVVFKYFLSGITIE